MSYTGQSMHLSRDCEVKFVPKEKIWRSTDFSLYVCAWDGSGERKEAIAQPLKGETAVDLNGGAYSR